MDWEERKGKSRKKRRRREDGLRHFQFVSFYFLGVFERASGDEWMDGWEKLVSLRWPGYISFVVLVAVWPFLFILALSVRLFCIPSVRREGFLAIRIPF